MPRDYSSATLQLPEGYFVTHLRQMGSAAEQFPGLKIVQGMVEKVTVVGSSPEAQEVALWVQRTLAPLG